ncbi:MAG: hypothetical protein Q9200_000764 [Gallowayella weberi]
MYLHLYLVTSLILSCGLVQSLPALHKRNWKINNDKCPRSQKDKDLITTELGRAADMWKAAAGATLDGNNRWVSYFIDDETVSKSAKRIQQYFEKMSSLDGDSDYTISITCPVKKGDADWDACGESVWAATNFSLRRTVVCPIWFDGYKGGKKQTSKLIEDNCKPGATGEKN